MSAIILNIHGIGPVSRSVDAGERNCWLDKERFEPLLDLIREYPNVRLTVDDGNVSDFDIILPALLRRGLRAKFFVCSGRLDQVGFLRESQIRELQAQGMEIGSHGIAHIPWRGLSKETLQEELETSRRVLERVCGLPIESAACPFGAYDHRVLSGLRKAGYRTVYTSDGGACYEDHWLQARTTVTRSISLDEIRHLIERGPGIMRQMSIAGRALIKRLR
ncbi:MAG: polysaccharide deacetylase family protein [Lentisphaerae bacterium]|nr:polysaccharide deacetylase family protein [Lentisphaerota bacterium]